MPGASTHSWHPVMSADTTEPRYWWNWRFCLCAIWVLASMIAASILIWKYEGHDGERSQREAENQRSPVGTLYADEAWRPCLKQLHPAWLLAFRVLAFSLLSALLAIYVVVDGRGVFYYYTQWTFTLVTLYFGLGSLLSVYGCYQYVNKVGGAKVNHTRLDHEQGECIAHTDVGNSNARSMKKCSVSQEEHSDREIAGFWGYLFQIIYQTNAGAVMLTDCVFWLVLFPFLTMKKYDLNFFLVGMHSVNAVFLLVDTFLNQLRFPWFRISYFLLWTSIYVIFQWIVHACVPVWWPYPFLDLSSNHAPLWYLLLAVLHAPCYAIFSFVIKLKHFLLSRWFPQSYQCLK
ncbi:MFS general substrate transporter domain-containing protein [Dioscorea alata]|uniref:MFS general substrate transporter domain-containing protein n=1 Tax=Dioscorea alata TaxID=55571 RepID=A0ACB7UF47_DIOAL|nr:MFS general substrate transporter domain-containing protein [Dioscorea alata]